MCKTMTCTAHLVFKKRVSKIKLKSIFRKYMEISFEILTLKNLYYWHGFIYIAHENIEITSTRRRKMKIII